MRIRRTAPVLGLIFLVVLPGLLWWLWRNRARDELFRRLPGENVLLLHLDVAALRRTNALAPLLQAQVTPDPDYGAFVRETHFDYQRDLDQAAVCWLPDRVYILARGRFDPERLRAYAISQGGACSGRLLERPCNLPAGRPGRRISFWMPSSRLLALATAPESDAVLQLQNEPAMNATALARAAQAFSPEASLVWLTTAPSTLGQVLPGAGALLAGALSNAQRIYLFLNPSPAGVQIALHADCLSDSRAEETKRLLQGISDLMAGLTRRGPAEWSRLLSSAAIQQQGTTVRATWQIDAETLRLLGSATSADPNSSPDRRGGKSAGSGRSAGKRKD